MKSLPRACLRTHPEGKKWVVEEEFSLFGYTIPKGFITDLASIPAPVRMLISVNGKHREAAILHDYLYHTGRCTREQADDYFNRAMKLYSVSVWKRWAMYKGVQAGGWYTWNQYRKG